MWHPSWNLANLIFDVSNIILIIALAAVAAATVAVVWMGNVKEEYLRREVATTNERAAALEVEAAAARAELGRAQVDIAKANESAAKANERAEEMRQKIGPRRIDEKIFLEKISGVPKMRVLVSHAPDEPDSYFLANNVLGVLGQAQWDARYVGNTSEAVKMCGAQLGGVLVLAKSISNEEAEDLQKPPRERRKTAWIGLTDALVNSLAPHNVGGATCPFVSEGTLQVVVSPRWVFFPKEQK